MFFTTTQMFSFLVALAFATTVGLAGAAERPISPIPFTLAQSGYVSAAVYDQAGHLVRELLHAVPMTAGKQSMIWDGLDRDGNGAPAGVYSWKILQTQGLTTRYLMSLGSNYPIGKNWRNACGPGTHSAPFGVAVDATGLYIAANTTENIETCLLKLSPDGTSRQWSSLQPKSWDGALSLAVDNGELFMLGHTAASDGRISLPPHQLVYIFDAATGKLASHGMAATGIGPVPVKIDVQWNPGTKEIDATDMDAHGGLVVVAYAKHDALRWYDAKTGELLDTATVPVPQGVTVGERGAVYVSTSNRIVRLSRANKMPVEVVAGLAAPGRLDLDHATGDLLVFLVDMRQIARFAADGTPSQIYGRPGGRQDGLYDDAAKRSFAGFSDLCADGAGGFYVTEAGAAPRRTAHFGADGSVIREWYGGQRWAPHATPEPGNPNVVWVGSQYGWIMRVLVDYAKQTWQVHSCYQYSHLANGLVGDSWNEGGFFQVYRHDGCTYLALVKMATILKVDETEWKLLPVTVCGEVGRAPAFIKKWADGNVSYQWNDGDGDGLPQREEATFYAAPIPRMAEPTIAADFTVFSPGDKVYAFPVTAWNAVGAPLYGDMPGGKVYGEFPERFGGGMYHDSRWSAFLHHDPVSGRLYGALNNGTTGWCASMDSVMQTWNADGSLAWGVGEQGVNPGQIRNNLRGIAGVAHGCVVAIDVDGGWNMANLARSYVWDRNGLFVGGLMDYPDTNSIPDFMYQGGGEFCHSALYTLPNGDVYFYGNWENEVRVYQVTGWDNWVRKSGKLKVTTPGISQTGTGLTAEYFAKPDFTGRRKVCVEGPVEFTGDAKIPAGGVRWSGAVCPTYGPSYSAGWSYLADLAAHDGGYHGARDMKARMTCVFKGTSVALVGRTRPDGGYAKVSLDGKFQKQVDYYSPVATNDVVIFKQDGLPPGDHTLELEVVGWLAPRNPASSDGWVTVDKIVTDDLAIDDNGISYAFSTTSDGGINLYVDRKIVITDWCVKASAVEKTGAPLKLLRQPYPLQLDWFKKNEEGTAVLTWSSPLDVKQPIPVTALFPQVWGAPITWVMP